MDNNKGQGGMIFIIFAIVLAIVAVILLAAMAPDLISEWSNQGSSYKGFNCQGYVDADASGATPGTITNGSYDSSAETNTLGCSIRSFGIPIFLILALLAIIGKAFYGGSSTEQYA